MYQQLWGYKVEEKLYLGVRGQKRLNTTALNHGISIGSSINIRTPVCNGPYNIEGLFCPCVCRFIQPSVSFYLELVMTNFNLQ
jgi:hypothetical protein